ncbi:MAG: Gfo/Idh/MocA family oxidoreductase [Acidobacteria bacterium]|nr:Gfo/Idh/MocA family oxidoreductase [Planctomycetota bacterium]MBE3132388.1 Gfo/Idh/MocA family oxidoreductase [Acidobacteriota bacterium]
MARHTLSRRQFLGGAAAAATAFAIVPRRVLGGEGHTPPSEVITQGTVGTGGQGMSHVNVNAPGETPTQLAVCDVDKGRLAGAMKKAGSPCEAYDDFRRVMDRKDIDVIRIGTPPHWHALVSIAAIQAGKDVLCEKPMTKFMAEGQAVAQAARQYKRMFQIGTYGRFGSVHLRKLVASGLLGTPLTVRLSPGTGYNWKVKEWSGRPYLEAQPVPPALDYDLWLGPAPVKPYHPHRVHGSFRCYWDYDGGGLADMGQHYLDGVQYFLGKDDTSPSEIEAYAEWPQHHDAVRMWGRVTMKYADGTTLILASAEWGEFVDEDKAEQPWIEGPRGKVFKGDRTEPEGLMEQARALPDPPPLVGFWDAVRNRRQPGGNADASYRCSSLMHLANIAIRTGRKLRYDPVAHRFVNDDYANRFIDIPMRAPWHL